MDQAQSKLQPLPEESGLGERSTVIIGNGPVGMRMAQELLDRVPDTPVIIYGDEQHPPYNRVRLSSWLAGEIDRDSLVQALKGSSAAGIEQRIGYRIESIDTAARIVVDNTGRFQPYAKLILATGSRPYVPDIPGIGLPGVFTFRDLDDTTRLLARRASTHRTVVLGGGLLGLEAARGMQPGNTAVTVVEHADRLLGNQLDADGSRCLQDEVEALGIEVVIGDGVARILGGERVRGVRLRSGRELPCDTVVVATGIRSNIDLARQARIAFGRGVTVDDNMKTSQPDVYAVGECAEHRGRVYGLVAPGFEQAGVAAADIAGRKIRYTGSVASSRLKVVGTQVFSMGPMGDREDRGYGRMHVYRDGPAGVYRKIFVRKHHLVGALGIGDWDETVRLQARIGRAEAIWPWQVWRFRHTGRIWPEGESRGVAAWPPGAVVCQCTGVTRGVISEAVSLGASGADDVARATGASTVCGSCKPLVLDLLGEQNPIEPAAMYRSLLAFAGIALVATLAFVLLPAIPYADSVRHDWHWDALWRNSVAKQVTGFSVLALLAAGLLISIRKRVRPAERLGRFDVWRMAHIVLGLGVILGLVLHTGLRTGEGLDFLLMSGFLAMLAVGAVSSAVIATGHVIGGDRARRWRVRSVFLHILLFWPVPVLLGWHVFKGYWY